MFEPTNAATEPLPDSAEERLQKFPDGQDQGIAPAESLLAFAAAIGATLFVRHALQAGWRKTLHREPPKNPTAPTVDWTEALLWGAISGALIGMSRIASRRTSSMAYRTLRNESQSTT